jgi:type IV secretory pathway protease TraF
MWQPRGKWRRALKTTIHYVLRIIVAIAVIIGVGKLLKLHERVTIDATDQSVDQVDFPPGAYSVNTYLTPSQYQQGDMVAFYIPGQADAKVARVVATEGQMVELNGQNVLVDGKPTKYSAGYPLVKLAPFKVPHACVYLVCDKPMYGKDSTQLGPIPSYSIFGKLK